MGVGLDLGRRLPFVMRQVVTERDVMHWAGGGDSSGLYQGSWKSVQVCEFSSEGCISYQIARGWQDELDYSLFVIYSRGYVL
jgi:hypothetical protein